MGALGTLIYLLRHGEVEGAERPRFVGHVDVALSPRGLRQAAAQAHRLRAAGLAAIFTSDLARARRTGEIIGAPHGLTPTIVPAFREMNMGRWDGLTAAEITERDPAAFAAWTARIAEVPFPDGESAGDLLARVWPAFSTVLRSCVAGPIAVVGHGGTNRVLLCRALGLPLGRLLTFSQDYGALTVLEHDNGRWRLHRLNDPPLSD
ncbi:MAG TPA: histidine phosphatase family protein [Methylomirabilota bacterium]|nr:histidine phosphatase family protein [Methylomirabilota bacterium]